MNEEMNEWLDSLHANGSSSWEWGYPGILEVLYSEFFLWHHQTASVWETPNCEYVRNTKQRVCEKDQTVNVWETPNSECERNNQTSPDGGWSFKMFIKKKKSLIL